MSQFRPTRASPLVKPNRNLENTVDKIAADISRSSTATSVPELTGLTPDEIDLLDAVIDRAGPSATSFVSIFKAYSDVLRERNLNPEEVVFYQKLLKLGTMKGKNWGDKWNAVKSQHVRLKGRENSDYRGIHLKPATHAPRRDVQTKRRSPPSDDTFTLHSHNDHESPTSPLVHPASTNQLPRRPRAYNTTSWASDDLKSSSLLFSPISRPRRDEDADLDIENYYAPSTSTTSPLHLETASIPRPQLLTSPLIKRDAKSVSSATARKVVAIARQGRGSVVNEEDAWNKIRIQRNEAEADRFRKTQILERCWDVWRQGFKWIMTTNGQIAEARDNLILRIHLQRWRSVVASRQDIYQRITILSDNRCRSKTLLAWRNHLKKREQNKWRQDMRQRMKKTRDNRDLILRKYAWEKWCRLYRSHLATQHYSQRVTHRFYERWKQRIFSLNAFESIADDVFQTSQERRLVYFWDHWRAAKSMRASEQIMFERVSLRLMGNAVSVWRTNMEIHKLATTFYQLNLLKSTIKSWKAARDRIHTLENRALKRLARQDGVLLRAVYRVWKARSRGKAFERLNTSNLLYVAWSVWREQLQQHRRNDERALAFARRGNSSTMVLSFRQWQEAHFTHRNSQFIAVRYDSVQLCDKALFTWRIRLRAKLNAARNARDAADLFVSRRAMRYWHAAMKARVAEKRLVVFQKQCTKTAFYTWLHQTRLQKHRRLAEETIKENMDKRILQDALTIWINRVIVVKDQELDVARNFDAVLQAATFMKWRKAYTRHFEVFSLMQSYLLVKREENMRRVFSRWLGLARVTRHRRITLKEKEDEVKLSVIAYTWDKWRERFSDEKLRSTERVVMTYTEKNAMFRAFGLWRSKTKSLPAIRFYVNHLKAKYFVTWRQAMPRALQAGDARKKARESILKKCFKKWAESAKKKIDLKAVRRARYLGLPAASPRKTHPGPQTIVTPNSSFLPSYDHRPRAPSPQQDRSPPLRPRPFSERALGSRFSGPRTRETSPARSKTAFTERENDSPPCATPSSETDGNERVRSRLWLELREVKRRPRPSSLHSRPRE